MNTITIRCAVSTDIPTMVELLEILFRLEDDFSIDATTQTRGLEQLLSTPGTHAWVAVLDSQIAGMLTLQCLVSTALGGPVGLLEDLVIRPEHRDLGIGSALLATAMETAIQLELKQLRLLADSRNHKALLFYGRKGWRSSHMGGWYLDIHHH